MATFRPRAVTPASLSAADGLRLASALGETHETVIPVHLLRRGLCSAWVTGTPDRFEAAVIQQHANPAEPFAFGAPSAAWSILRTLPGWSCVNASSGTAIELADEIACELGTRPRSYGDIYLTLTVPPPSCERPEVRRLSLEDLPTLVQRCSEIAVSGFDSPETMLRDGICAAAIVDGRVVTLAYTSALSTHYADLAVTTLDPWRGRGLATAAATVVARGVLDGHRMPVWSAGDDNFASLRVAAKLGFREVGRRCYLLL